MMTNLEKINAIIKEGFGVELNNTEKQGLLSSKQVLTTMFDEEGEIQFVIVEGADPENDNDNESSFNWWNESECIEDCAKCAHQHECTHSGQALVF